MNPKAKSKNSMTHKTKAEKKGRLVFQALRIFLRGEVKRAFSAIRIIYFIEENSPFEGMAKYKICFEKNQQGR